MANVNSFAHGIEAAALGIGLGLAGCGGRQRDRVRIVREIPNRRDLDRIVEAARRERARADAAEAECARLRRLLFRALHPRSS